MFTSRSLETHATCNTTDTASRNNPSWLRNHVRRPGAVSCSAFVPFRNDAFGQKPRLLPCVVEQLAGCPPNRASAELTREKRTECVSTYE
ncbi:hypothetical protein MRX96_058695 [Rhipicephalus microplus]